MSYIERIGLNHFTDNALRWIFTSGFTFHYNQLIVDIDSYWDVEYLLRLDIDQYLRYHTSSKHKLTVA